MPSTKKKKLKDIHMANSMQQLNKLADVAEKASVNPKALCKAADRLFLKAQDSDDINDEEMAYIFYVRYFTVISQIKKSASYKKDKEYFDRMTGTTKAMKAITQAEKLQTSLSERYEEKEKTKEDEELAKKLAGKALNDKEKQPKENDTQVKPSSSMDDDLDSLLDGPTLSSGDIYQKLKVNHSNILTPKGSLFSDGVNDSNALIPGLTNSIPCLTPEQLYSLMKTASQSNLLIFDIRPQKEYAKNHIHHSSCINIPAELLENGVSVSNIERRLQEKTRVVWRQRGSKDYLIVVDKSSKAIDLSPASKLFQFKEAIYKNDSSCVLRNEPIFLDGGFESWLWHYPSLATKPELPTISPNTNSKELIDISTLDFPELPIENPPPVQIKPQPINEQTSIINDVYPSIPNSIASSKPSVTPYRQEQVNEGEVPTNHLPKAASHLPTYQLKQDMLNHVPKPTEPKPTTVPDPILTPKTSTMVSQIPGNQSQYYPGATPNVASQSSNEVKSPKESNHTTVPGNVVRQSNFPGTIPVVSSQPSITHQGHQPSVSQGEISGRPSKQMNLPGQTPTADKPNLLAGQQDLVSGQPPTSQAPVRQQPTINSAQVPAQPAVNRNQAPGNQATTYNQVPGHPITNQSQVPGHPITNQSQVPGHPITNQSQVPGHPITNQSQVPGHPITNQSQVPGHPITNQSQVPGHPITNQSQVPGHPITNQSQVPGHPIANQSQVPGHPITDQSQVPGHPMTNQGQVPGYPVNLNNQDPMSRQPTTSNNQSQVPGNLSTQSGVGQRPGHPPVYGQSVNPAQQKTSSQNAVKPSVNQGGAKLSPTSSGITAPGNERTLDLPPGWERCLDGTSNRVFYKDHKTQTTHWSLPSNTASSTIPKAATPTQDNKPNNREHQDVPSIKQHTPQQPQPPKQITPGQTGKPKSTLRRSLSSPNLANLDDNHDKIDAMIDRSRKPAVKPSFSRNSKPLTTAKIDSLNPVRGGIGRGLTGLRNLGNTCYMNSVLQCLFSTAPLAQYFISGTFRDDLNTKNPMGTRGELAEQFSLLVRVAHSGQFKSLSPLDFKRTVGKTKSSFSGFDQQDSQEFLALMMDKLHEDVNMILKKPYLEAPGDDIEPSRAADIYWTHHKKRNQSIMLELFDGLFMSTVRCMVCQKESVTFETFSNLTLPLPGQSNHCTLKDCINLFTRPEKMSGDDKWNCPQCKQHREAIKQLQIWRLPPILVIHLKRFQYDGMWKQKLQTNVSFPLVDLDMSSHVTGPKSQIKYTLYGVSNHYGTMHGGHYTAFCRNSHDKRWCKFDDQVVSEISNSNAIVTSAGYLLFYTSIPFQPPKLI